MKTIIAVTLAITLSACNLPEETTIELCKDGYLKKLIYRDKILRSETFICKQSNFWGCVDDAPTRCDEE